MMQLSLDGFVAGPNGEEDWIVRGDEKLFQLISDIADDSGTILLGRKMAEGFVPHFESATPDQPKYDFS